MSVSAFKIVPTQKSLSVLHFQADCSMEIQEWLQHPFKFIPRNHIWESSRWLCLSSVLSTYKEEKNKKRSQNILSGKGPTRIIKVQLQIPHRRAPRITNVKLQNFYGYSHNAEVLIVGTKLSQNKFSWLTHNIYYYRITRVFQISYKMHTKCLVEWWIGHKSRLRLHTGCSFHCSWKRLILNKKPNYKLYYNKQWERPQLS